MASLTNTPSQQTLLTLAARKSFSFTVQFLNTNETPLALTGASVSFTIGEQHYSDTPILSKQADTIVEASGVALFNLQASELDLEPGIYPYEIVLLSVGYSAIAITGELEIVESYEVASLNETYDVAPSTFGLIAHLKHNRIVVTTSTLIIEGPQGIQGEQGPQGEQGEQGPGGIPGGPAGGVLSGFYPDPDFAEDMATQAELDAAVEAAVNDGDPAGGVLAGTYPNPTFADDMATQAELDAVAAAAAAASAAVAAAAVNDGDAAGGVLAGTYPNPTFAADMATQAELNVVSTGLADHLADPTAAHAASAVSYAGSTGLTATTVEGAIDELNSPAVFGFYPPRKYGSVGTGLVDDLTAINAAINDASANGGGIVSCHSSDVHAISDSIVMKSNVSLHLNGCTIQPLALPYQFSLIVNEKSTDSGIADNDEKISIRGFGGTLDGRCDGFEYNACYGYGIELMGVDDAVIDNTLHIINTPFSGIEVNGNYSSTAVWGVPTSGGNFGPAEQTNRTVIDKVHLKHIGWQEGFLLLPQDTPVQANTGGSILAGTTYRAKFTAVNAAGETLPSSEQSILIGPGTNTNKITWSWPAVTGATSYNIYITDPDGAAGTETFVANVLVPSYVQTAADPNDNVTTPPSATPLSQWGDSGFGIIARSGTRGLTVTNCTAIECEVNSFGVGQMSSAKMDGDPPTLAHVSDIEFSNLYADQTSAVSHGTLSPTYRIAFAARVTLNNCIAIGNTDSVGFEIRSAGSGYESATERVTLNGCISEGNNYGFSVSTQNNTNTTRQVVLSGCIAKGNLTTGFQSTNPQVLMIGCHAIDNDSHGFRLLYDSPGSSPIADFDSAIIGCHASNNGSTGILLDGCNDVVVTGCVVTDTRAGGSRTQDYGIREINGATRNKIANNSVTNNVIADREPASVASHWDHSAAVVKASNESTNTDTTFSNDAELSVQLLANSTYEVELYLIVGGPTAADIKLRWATLTGMTAHWTMDGIRHDVATTTYGTIVRADLSETGNGVAMTDPSNNTVVTAKGIFTTGSTAGALTLMWAQSVSDGTNTTVYAGSTLKVKRLNR